jgi:hypothetical protein
VDDGDRGTAQQAKSDETLLLVTKPIVLVQRSKTAEYELGIGKVESMSF